MINEALNLAVSVVCEEGLGEVEGQDTLYFHSARVSKNMNE